MPSRYNHRKYYQSMKNRKQIGKFDITTGMIVTFAYQGYDKRPLVFVIDTDEYAPVGKKTFSGVNLNYLPISEVNNLFVRVLQKASWELDKKTKVPKVDLFDEENPGAKIEPIYNSIIKATLLNRRKDCYRTYSYASLKGSVEIVKFEFNVSPLKEIVNQDFKKLDKINRTTMYQLLRGNDGPFDEDKL